MTSNSLIFYTNPMSRGQIIRWMLEEVGAPYETKILDYGAGLKDPAYLAINPMGKVPAIQHEGRVITECAAICAYLADAFPQAGLAPPLADRADYYRWLFFAAGPLEQAIFLRQMGQSPDAALQRSAGFGHYDLTVDVLESRVSGRTYIAGDHFTAADLYVGSHIDWGLLFGTLPSRPAFEDYIARLRDRPAYARAKAIDNALIAEMQPPAT
jgi:glutathione S-transferase